MTTSPLISIVMAEFNTDERHLRDSLQSIVSQTYREFELIIVDDGSERDVSALVDVFNDPRIRVIKHPENLGFVRALETGVGAASSDLIVRMDTDDLYSEEHLDRLVLAAAEYPQYAAISAMSREFSDDGRAMVLGREGEKTRRDLLRGDGLIHPATLIRKSALLRVGGYPDQYKRAEDLALWFELLLAGERLYMTGDITHRYRVELQDYTKRRLYNRSGELRARLHYYPRLYANPLDYLRLLRSILSGVLPPRVVRALRRMIRPAART